MRTMSAMIIKRLCAARHPRLALRLAGLQVYRGLRDGSPDRCAASPPGNYATLRFAPGGGAERLARATSSPPSAGW